MGRPVATCSSPSSSMMPVPEAGRLHSTRRPIAASKGSMTSGGEAVRIGRERPLEHHAHHLPVAGGGVLAGAALDAGGRRSPAGAASPSGSPTISPSPRPARLGSGTSTAFEHVPQGVRALVSVGGRVGQRPGAAAVEHAHEHSRHLALLLRRAAGRAGASPGTPRAGGRRSRECTAGWSPRWRGRASPARCAGRRRAASRCVANECRNVCALAAPSMSARASTRRRM